MNKVLEGFARQQLKDGIVQCTDKQRAFFNKMYSDSDAKIYTFEEAGKLDINNVIDNMPAEKLDWAMRQVESTLEKNKKSS